MWWQIIPPAATIIAVTCVPYIGFPVIHYVFTGRPTMRGLTEGTAYEIYQRHGFRRDWHMTGCEYESRGLDYITDDL